MISLILPAGDDATALAHALAALVPAAADGTLREAIVIERGAGGETLAVADAAGCRIVEGTGRLGADLAAAAALARSDWLLFLAPRAVLDPGWQREARDFIDRVAASGKPRAASFRPARSGFGLRTRLAETAASLRSHLFAAPYLEEGLLVPTALYRALGGHRAMAGMADVDLARRIGRGRLSFLRSRAVLRGDGAPGPGFGRALRNSACLALFVLRAPSALIGRIAA